MSSWYSSDGPLNELPLDDRGLQYGDGLFETIAIRDGQPRLMDRHLSRMADGCRRLGLPYPGDDAVEGLARRVLDGNGGRGVLKLILTAGSGPRGYARPEAISPRLFARFTASTSLPASHYETGVAVSFSAVTASIQPRLAGIKSLNRLDQVLARNEIGNDFEHLLCDVESRIICGTMSNVMLVIDEHLVTPDLARAGVAGVMRSAILDALPDIDIRDVQRDEADKASELILCNSQFGVLPVAALDRRALDDRRGFERVRSALAAAGVVEP